MSEDSAYRQAREQHDGQLLRDVFAREDREASDRATLDSLTVRHLLKTADDIIWAARDMPQDGVPVAILNPWHLRLLCEAWLRNIEPVPTPTLADRLSYLVSSLPSRCFTWPDGFTIDLYTEQEVDRAQIMLPLDLRAPPGE